MNFFALDLPPHFVWPNLVGGLVVFALCGIAAQMLHAWLKKKSARTETETNSADNLEPRVWRIVLSAAGAPPLALLLWVWGASAALLFIEHGVKDGDFSRVADEWLHWLNFVAVIAAGVWFAFLGTQIMEIWMRRWWTPRDKKWDLVFGLTLLRALRLAVPFIAVFVLLRALHIPEEYKKLFSQITSLFLIGGAGYLLVQTAMTLEKTVMDQFNMNVQDNLSMRKIYTQVNLLRKIAIVIIAVFTVACMLMVFEPIRHLGTSMLASAGVAGIVIGFAAQRSLATFVAGMQIAFTQPIRIDDVVIVESEWGRIEEITLTYVVVLIWDQRRLVVPITYFIEKPFQNWTRVNAELIGSVFIYADYTAPLDAMRAEMDRILDSSKKWDHRAKVLQVTDSKEKTIEIRMLMSAANAGNAWDLRCEVREKMITFLQENHPQCLPRLRVVDQSGTREALAGTKTANGLHSRDRG